MFEKFYDHIVRIVLVKYSFIIIHFDIHLIFLVVLSCHGPSVKPREEETKVPSSFSNGTIINCNVWVL